MKRQGLILLTVLMSLLLICTASFAQSQQITNGLNYLTTTQNPDGTWGTELSGAEILPSTVSVMETLQILNQSNTTNYTNALLWLQSQGLDTTDNLSERIHALSVAGADLVLLLSYLDEFSNSWGYYSSFQGNTCDTALALQALKQISYSDQNIINSVVEDLLSTQNSDGGWGLKQGMDSEIFYTALVSSTLQQFPQTTLIATAINKATTYLISHQNADGGFGEDSITGQAQSTVYETALVLIVLINSNTGQAQGQPLQIPIQNANNYIESTQLPDGSWNDDPYSTALALHALSMVKPNLSIALSDITFSNSSPTVGDSITITATVHNNGPSQADNVVVQFYNNDPSTGGTLIGEALIPSIPAFGSFQSSTNFTVPAPSTYTIFVKIDPTNTIDELNETDNIASKNLTSSTLPDLSITSADITIMPSAPTPGESFLINAEARNKGESSAGNVTLAFYDGDPNAGGTFIGNSNTLSIAPGSMAYIMQTANLPQGLHNIYVLADSANTVHESNETNNTAIKTVNVGLGFTDLSIREADITFGPEYPVEGNTVTLNASVRNSGETSVSNAVVRYYLGDPSAGGTQIGSDIVIPQINAMSSAPVSTSLNTTGHAGNNTIYIVADPNNIIAEINEYNNQAYKTLKVASSNGPDLTLTSTDITFSPQSPNKGDLVTISANIRNTGIQDANNVLVQFSVYNTAINSSLIIGMQTIALIPKGGSFSASILWDTSGFSGGSYSVIAEVDPSNETPELNEENNETSVALYLTAPQGPDIVISRIDITGVSSDTQTRSFSGNVDITIKNAGNQNVSSPFVLTAFEDRNNNMAFDPGTDIIVGQITYSDTLNAETENTITMPVSGTVLFIDSPMYLLADSGNIIPETDESNNIECLGIFTLCRHSNVDAAVKQGASWLIDHQLNVDTQGTMKAWAGSSALYYDALAIKAYKATGKTTGTKYSNVLNKLIQMQAPDGSWEESLATTGEAILSLLYVGSAPDSASIIDAVEWIKRQQNADGGWGDAKGSQSMASITGKVLTALLKTGINKNEFFIQKAAQWLKTTQSTDGYWGWYPGDPGDLFIDTYPVIGLALATSPSDSSVIKAKNWYTNGTFTYRYECFLVYWLKMMLEIEPSNSNIANAATTLLTLQRTNGGWKPSPQYINPFFNTTADAIYGLSRFGYSGTNIDNGIFWIENHINTLWEGFPEDKSVIATALSLDALQIANISDFANLNAIATGRKAIVSSQNSDGSYQGNIPVPSPSSSFTHPTGESLFALKYFKNISSAEQYAVYKAINYLASSQASDGGWSYVKGYTNTLLAYSQIALQSLLQSGLTASNTTISRGLSYLNSKQSQDGSFGNVQQTARAAIIYKLAGANYQTKLNQTIAWIKSNQNPDGGWGTMLGYTSTTSSTSWALIALSYAGESGIEVARGVSWLLAAQNEDRGWGEVMGVPMSNEYSTAMAVWALSLAKYSMGFNIEASTERQNYCPGETVKITATPDVPVQDITITGSVSLQEGTNYPLTFTTTENAFNNKITVPSDALPGTSTVHVIGIATYGYGIATTKYYVRNCTTLKPDLSINEADLKAEIVDAHNPDSRVIYATVKNPGSVDAKDVTVKFYNGSPFAGSLIGSVIIPYITASASYTAEIPVTINEGTYISVVVDPDNIIAELDETNNTASMILTRTIPDLSISPSDITIVPPVIEGQSANITAIVHNIGNLGASDVAVHFYDGDPAQSGVLIGSQTKSFIDAGATALTEVTWNTFGQSGTNYIHVVVDPQNLITEANENNNTTLIPVDVASPSKPDLAITSSDITFSNLNPQEGEPLVITANIHNFGTDASDIKVDLYDENPSATGSLLSTYTIQQIILFGGMRQITFTVNTVGLSGNHEFHIVLDPDNTIDETNETNNTAWNSLTIGPSGLSLAVSSDKTTYTSNENVQITVNTGNHTGLARTGTLEVKITDLNSNVAATVSANQTLSLGPNENSISNYIWNTGQTFSGDYKVYVVFMENGNIIAKAETPISISKDMNITSAVTTDRISYYPSQSVTITSTITSGSANYIFENLTATITISDQLSVVSLHIETQTIPILMPGQLTEFKTYWNTSTNPAGTYPVTLEVKDSLGNILSTSTSNITISSEIKPSKLLKGQISVDKQSILQGEPENITYSVTNIGNTDLSQIDLSVLIVHVVNLNTYDTLTDQTALQMGGTYTNSQQLNTQNYSAKDYLVILRANISGIEESLASTYFRVEGAPSAPSLNSPQHGADVETLTPLLVVNNASDPNDDKLTYEFEIYSDPGLTALIALSESITEGTGTTSWQTTLALIENSVYYWRVRAYDGLLYGEWMAPAAFRVNLENEPPTAPTLSSPALNSSVDTLTPLLTVNNASDPDSSNLTYNFILASDPELTQIVSSETGIFQGNGTTSWPVTVSLNENTTYYWSAQADDWLITGPWMSTASFFVNTANDAPSAPVIISPANNSEITTLFADIAVSNSTDPDSFGLTYIFEADTVMTFDSSNIINSGSVPEGQSKTLWFAENLNDNTYYYVRAKASDGLAESDWSEVVGFFVNTVNDAPSVPVLSNPSNGSGVNLFNPPLSVHNSTDIDGDILTYEFELYADPAMTDLISTITGVQETALITSWTVALNLEENKTYYWKARAYDGELYSGWMPLASFMVNTANDAPSAPTLNAPADGSSLDTLNPILSVYNAVDPDSDTLTYDFEIYLGSALTRTITGISEDNSGITSLHLTTPLSDNTSYTWRARAYDGDRYGAWMDMASFSIHLPSTNITATINFDPDTLNQKSKGNWVTVYIELPGGYNIADINVSSLLLNNTVDAETWPYAIGDNDKDGIPDLMVKFNRDAVINILPNGDNIQVKVTGTIGTTTFEGVDRIRVIK